MQKIITAALGATAMAIMTHSAMAQSAAPSGVTGDMKIELNAVPPVVLMTANRHVPGLKLTAAGVDLGEDGMLVYEVAGTDGSGKKVEIDVHEDGRVDEIEREIAMTDVPAAVSKLMKAYLADFQATKVELSLRPNLTMVYEFEGKHGGREIDIEISAAGDRIVIVDDLAA